MTQFRIADHEALLVLIHFASMRGHAVTVRPVNDHYIAKVNGALEVTNQDSDELARYGTLLGFHPGTAKRTYWQEIVELQSGPEFVAEFLGW